VIYNLDMAQDDRGGLYANDAVDLEDRAPPREVPPVHNSFEFIELHGFLGLVLLDALVAGAPPVSREAIAARARERWVRQAG